MGHVELSNVLKVSDSTELVEVLQATVCAETPCLAEWHLLIDAVLSDDDDSLLPMKDFHCSPLLNRLS
jgi:hypothetical protein